MRSRRREDWSDAIWSGLALVAALILWGLAIYGAGAVLAVGG